MLRVAVALTLAGLATTEPDGFASRLPSPNASPPLQWGAGQKQTSSVLRGRNLVRLAGNQSATLSQVGVATAIEFRFLTHPPGVDRDNPVVLSLPVAQEVMCLRVRR